MPFFRASGGAGGAGVVDCLADINEQLEGLGENEYLVYISNTSGDTNWTKYTLTDSQTTINIPEVSSQASYVLVIVDFSKITFNSVKFSSDANINYGPTIYGVVFHKADGYYTRKTSVGYSNLSQVASHCTIGIYTGYRTSQSQGRRMYFTGANS